MGNGCLAPKAIVGDLAIQLIDELHADSRTAPKQQKYRQTSTSFSEEKQKIFKKAPLRKLIDYLSSHRQKLNDSLAHNLKVSIQGGAESSWRVGLIILERVILMATQGVSLEVRAPRIEQILRNKGQNSSYTDSEMLKGDLCTLKTQVQKENRSGYYSIQPNSETIVSQIMGNRFESILLDTINSCLEQPSLYRECIRILCDYLLVRPKSLHNQEKVGILLGNLLSNIKIDYQSVASFEAYYRVVSKLKDKLVLSMCVELKAIIQAWVEMKEAVGSTKNIGAISGLESKLNFAELIIGRFLSSSLNGMQYSTIIQLFLEIQDLHSFAMSLQFQSLYLCILMESQLGSHFLKALFLEYLRYAVVGNFSPLLYTEITENSKYLLSFNTQNNFKNIKEKKSRQNVYELIKRWLVSKKYISLEEIISYNSSLFLFCFLQNISDQFCRKICSEVVQQSTKEQKIVLIEAVFDLYQRKQTPSLVRSLLFSFYKPLSAELKEINLRSNISRFTIDTSHISASDALQLYCSMMEVYSKFDKETTLLYMQQICQLLGSMVSFLHQDKEAEKSKLSSNLIAFIQFIVVADASLIAVTCHRQILKIVQHPSLRPDQLQLLNRLLSEINKIFEKYRVSIHDPQESSTNFGSNRMGQYSCYFKDLLNDTKSRLGGEFEKGESVVKDSQEMKEEESLQDILEMINY